VLVVVVAVILALVLLAVAVWIRRTWRERRSTVEASEQPRPPERRRPAA
jgi:hypothetical protein